MMVMVMMVVVLWYYLLPGNEIGDKSKLSNPLANYGIISPYLKLLLLLSLNYVLALNFEIAVVL
jgi:hypothetical protein